MRIFLTGATGFIGGHVARRLAQSKHEMFCLVRKKSNFDALRGINARVVPGDVTDKVGLVQGMRDCDALINIAGLYDFWIPDKRAYAATNVTGVRNVMEAALETMVSKVVHVSSVVSYGKPADVPFTEGSAPGHVHFSDYARTKYEGDLIAWELHRTRNLPLVVVYPAAVVGPGDPKATGRYIDDFIHKRLPARVFEESVMTWVHVRDVAEAIVRALEKQDNIGAKYFVGKERLSFGEVSTMLSEISGVRGPMLRLPDQLAIINASLLTSIANVIKRPPPWGMSIDQARTMKEGFVVDGRKVERELCLEYTPVRVALMEAIATSQR